MTIVTMTLEEAHKKWTPEERAQLLKRLEGHIDLYDPECPPCSDEKLARFKPHKDVTKVSSAPSTSY